ncbi:MAG: N-methylhydantoinase [Thermoleophilaceae bacterium]|jgi:N-methylhydantoinase A/oxoprolinase/acetone carboxylase beta subunit|nr:N-methylhydantoinase [Thermoleophilaceae bacterium]
MGTTIDIDTGGTFTDVFVVRDGTPHWAKVLTTPHDLALCFQQAVERGAEEVGIDVGALLAEATCVRYATTVGTNAVIQRSGPKLGLIVGADGQSLYGDDERASAVFERFLERDMVASIGGDGDREIVAATKHLLDRSARGLVCAMPGADRDSAGEREVLDGFTAHYPKHCLDSVPLLLSHEIETDPDDFRRTATALFNAYVHPDVARYLYRAEDFLRDSGYMRPLLVVHNDGGCARVAKTIAGRTYNSGPMAGLMGAEVMAGLYGLDNLMTFDMGGTSLDVSFIAGGHAPISEHGRVEDVEISFSLAEVLALGAGGGSIAHIDGGELKVGPQSAGAKPGPACFGFGGDKPTVTDADVMLGIIDPDRFLGGRMKLDSQAAERAISALASELGQEPMVVAAWIRSTLHARTADQIAAQLDARGLDAAATTLLAYGGAGAAHATGVADLLGVTEILTPPFASVFSAFGASSADVVHTYVLPESADAEAALRARAIRDMRSEGFAEGDLELEVGSAERHGITCTRVQATARLEHYGFSESSNGAGVAEPRGTREVHWPGDGPLATAIYDAAGLGAGASLAGPAVIDAEDTTYAIPPGWGFEIDKYGNGHIRKVS